MVIFILYYLRAAGCLIGLAVGDALGAPLECLSPQSVPVKRFISGGVHGLPAGSATDDTYLALAFAESLIYNRGYSRDDFLRRMIDEYLCAPKFYGPTSRFVFEAELRKNNAVSQKDPAIELYESRGGRSGNGGRSNGSVMRGAPAGIFYPPATVREISMESSRITHRHPIACECTAFVNQMISRMVRGEEKRAAFEGALMQCGDEEVREMLENRERYPINPDMDALLTTHAAVSVFMDSSSFEEMIVTAVNMGGDADTVGAVCGALGGAYWGLESIPKDLVAGLLERERIEKAAFALAKAATE